MILSICVAGFTTLAAVGLSHIMQSRILEKVIYSRPELTTLAREQTDLAKIIIADLKSAVETEQISGDTLQSAVNGYIDIIDLAWKTSEAQLGQFEYNYVSTFVIPFVQTLKSATALQGDSPTSDFARLVIEIIEETVPVASGFLLRGDSGDAFSEPAYYLEKNLSSFCDNLEKQNNKRLAL